MDDPLNPFLDDIHDQSVDDILKDLQEASYSGFDLPDAGVLPTIESILNESDDADGSGSVVNGLFDSGASYVSGFEESSIASFDVINSNSSTKWTDSLKANDSILKLAKLRNISSELAKKNPAVNYGNPTAVLIRSRIAVGTSTGFVHIFDLAQKVVCRCSPTTSNAGPVSALDANREDRKLLVGFAKGLMCLYDFITGKLIQTIEDVHSLDCAVLHIKYTDGTNLAVFSDNGGSVFSLETKSTLGRRSATSTCIFSGSKGEAFAAQPLRIFDKFPMHRFSESCVVAVASLNKVIIAELKPAIRSLFSFPLNALPAFPPILEWHIVSIQTTETGRTIEPVLAVGSSQMIVFVQVSVDSSGAVKCSFIQRTQIGADVVNVKWMNNHILAVADMTERIHIVDIRSHGVLEMVDINFVGLIYQSSFYKGLATTRSVSPAMATAGDRACGQSIGVFHGQIVFLGINGVFLASLRQWHERVARLAARGKPLEALRLVLDIYIGKAQGILGLTKEHNERKAILRRQTRDLVQVAVDRCLRTLPTQGKIDALKDHYEAVIPLCMEACVTTGELDFLFGAFYDRFNDDVMARSVYLQCLEVMVMNDELREVSPGILQDLIELYETRDQYASIESCIVRLNVQSLDLHLVVGICRKYDLFDALAYVYTAAFNDARSPLEEYLVKLRNEMKGKPTFSDEIVSMGNRLILYLSCCLNGLKYPSGLPNPDRAAFVAFDVFQALISRHSRNPNEDEPVFAHLRTLLEFNTRETLNVFAIAFDQPYFNDIKGLEAQQTVVDKLQQVVVQGREFEPSQMASVFTFISRLMTKPDAINRIAINRMLIEQTLEVLCVPDTRNRHDEREIAVMELYDNAVLKHIADGVVVKLAETAGFWRLCEILYEKHDMYDKLLDLYLDDKLRQGRGHVFSFLLRVLISPLYEEREKSVVKAKCIERFPDLLNLDRQKAAQLTVTSLWDNVPEILQKLDGSVENQYLLMKSLFEFVLKTSGTVHDASAFPRSYHNTFIDLMCRVRPETVFDHIRFNNDYDLEAALDSCQKHGLPFCVAYLLEFRGDHQAALDVLMGELQRSTTAHLGLKLENLDDSLYGQTLKSLSTTLDMVIDFCQRIGAKLAYTPREAMWLRVLDIMLTAVRSSQQSSVEKYRTDLRRLCVDLLKGVSGQLDMLVLLKKILEDPAYSHGKFGELRDLLLGIVSAYTYEEVLWSATRNLIRKDIHTQISTMKKTASRGISVTNSSCPVCDVPLRRSQYGQRTAEDGDIILFRCGHGFHKTCLKGALAERQNPDEKFMLKCTLCNRVRSL